MDKSTECDGNASRMADFDRTRRAESLLERAEQLLNLDCPDYCDCEHCQWLGDYDEFAAGEGGG